MKWKALLLPLIVTTLYGFLWLWMWQWPSKAPQEECTMQDLQNVPIISCVRYGCECYPDAEADLLPSCRLRPDNISLSRCRDYDCTDVLRFFKTHAVCNQHCLPKQQLQYQCVTALTSTRSGTLVTTCTPETCDNVSKSLCPPKCWVYDDTLYLAEPITITTALQIFAVILGCPLVVATWFAGWDDCHRKPTPCPYAVGPRHLRGTCRRDPDTSDDEDPDDSRDLLFTRARDVLSPLRPA